MRSRFYGTLIDAQENQNSVSKEVVAVAMD